MLLGQDLQATASSPRKGRRSPLDYIIPPMKRPPHAVPAWFWITILVVLMVTVVIVISIMYWDWLSIESNGSTIRNIGLVAAAIIALPLALWRSKVAERQAATAQRQSETAQRGLLNERYQKGAEMLGSKVLAVRLGGIYALGRLAREHPGDYHTQIMSLLCAFLRTPPEMAADHRKLREDVQEVMTAICSRSDSQIEAEKGEYCPLELSGADLEGLDLVTAPMGMLVASSSEPTTPLNLNGANLTGANLRGAYLTCVSLKGANLAKADLTGAFLGSANLTDAYMSECKGLTQEEIDHAEAEPDNPPKLEGVVDADTGKPLVWRGRSPSHGRSLD